MPDANRVELSTGPDSVVMRINGRVVRQPYYAGETLVETARRAGTPILTNCLNGQCGTCMVQVRKGCVRMRKNAVLSEDDIASGLTLACQGIPQGAECEIEVY